MKVHELIAELQQFDQDFDVEYHDSQWGATPISLVWIYEWDDVPSRVVVE